MLGSVIGDIVGSIYEWHNVKNSNFPFYNAFSHFTDDTVLTIAVADALLNREEYGTALKRWTLKYPAAGYGGQFKKWVDTDSFEPYYSFGNGSAMRVGPVGWAFATMDDTLLEAKKSAECTHHHPEGIKGAQAVASAIFLARSNASKNDIKEFIVSSFGYDLDRTIAEMRPYYSFEVSCQHSVPQAIIAFLESTGFEHAIRHAISLGGDSDTIACITGSIAEAFYKTIPDKIVQFAKGKLTDEMNEIIDRFEAIFSS